MAVRQTHAEPRRDMQILSQKMPPWQGKSDHLKACHSVRDSSVEAEKEGIRAGGIINESIVFHRTRAQELFIICLENWNVIQYNLISYEMPTSAAGSETE